MSNSLRASLVYHQRIVEEKSISCRDSVTLGPESADFVVELFASPFVLYRAGEVRIPGDRLVSLGLGGKISMAAVPGLDLKPKSTQDGVMVFDFGPGDWLILNLADGLDMVLCHEDGAVLRRDGGLVQLAAALSTPLAGMLLLSFAIHGFVIFSAFWLSDEQEAALAYKPLSARWIELLTNVSEHSQQEDPPVIEPLPMFEEADAVIMDNSMVQTDRPKTADVPPSNFAGLAGVDRPVGLQAAFVGGKGHSMESLFGSTAGLGNAWDDMPESADGTAFGTGAGFAAGLSGVGFGGGGGGGGGGYGSGQGGGGRIGGLEGGGGTKSTNLAGPQRSRATPKPKLEMETAKQGAFCRESDIRDTVQKRAAALRNCYEQQLLADPKLSGKIVVFWKIGLDGDVTEASIKSTTMNNERVETCLTRTIRRLKFEKPDGGICVVEFPFVFTSAQ
ncbi:MAG: AgmX/PglI C-terminal domain-containing protein [Proteobacteria bacterium]|nr:AgmX/PglI C-terminal domain-containing protein [Pseudomonadota bacterium]